MAIRRRTTGERARDDTASDDLTDALTPRALAPRALARLLHHRWALPALAQVADERGSKFITLSKRLGVGAESLKRALMRLSELDLVVRNPGYGHPMRPEYVLGALGGEVSSSGSGLWRWIQRCECERSALKKWSLPTLLAVGSGAQRFNEIRDLVGEATARAITLALKDLLAEGLITRRVDEGFPPTPHYAPTARARTPLRHANVLGRALATALYA